MDRLPPTQTLIAPGARRTVTVGFDRSRRCTDPLWGIVFLVALVAFAIAAYEVRKISDIRMFRHDMDHAGNMCGFEAVESKPLAYYPDLHHDFLQDKTLKRPYSVCVEACPEVHQTITDYGDDKRQAEWYVPLPSFAVFGRCVPYTPTANMTGTLLCAMPQCNATASVPTMPQQVCGLRRDGTAGYWLLSPPDQSVIDGWSMEGANQSVIQARMSVAAGATSVQDTCLQPLRRENSLVLRPADEEVSYTFLTDLTGPAYEFFNVCYENQKVLLGAGVGGALLLSIVVMVLMPCLSHMVICLTLLLFVALFVAVDVVLFMKAGILPEAYLEDYLHNRGVNITIPAGAESMVSQVQGDWQTVYGACGVLLTLLTFFIICIIAAVRKDIGRFAELMKEGAQVTLKTPLLFVFAFVIFLSILAMGHGLLMALFGINTIVFENALPLCENIHIDCHQHFGLLQKVASAQVAFMFLWVYFFHVAVLRSTISHVAAQCESHHFEWSCTGILGAPVATAVYDIFRYSLGSLALGSLLMALVTVPRIVLEFIDRRLRTAEQENVLVKGMLKASRCCLWTLEKCLQFVTHYAYVSVAVWNMTFCKGAKKTLHMLIEEPVLVALEQATCFVLSWITCISVPLCMVFVLPLLGHADAVSSGYLTIAIAGLAFITSRMAIITYDASVTGLLVVECDHRMESERRRAQHGYVDDAPPLLMSFGPRSRQPVQQSQR